MDTRIWKLYIPLAGLFLVSLALHRWWPADGFFLNLSTEVIGIVITVTYVEKTLKALEVQRWSAVELTVKSRLMALLSINQRKIATILKKSVADCDAYIGVAPREIPDIQVDQWKSLEQSIRVFTKDLHRFLTDFARFSPSQAELLLELERACELFIESAIPFQKTAGFTSDKKPTRYAVPETGVSIGLIENASESLWQVWMLTKDFMRRLQSSGDE